MCFLLENKTKKEHLQYGRCVLIIMIYILKAKHDKPENNEFRNTNVVLCGFTTV